MVFRTFIYPYNAQNGRNISYLNNRNPSYTPKIYKTIYYLLYILF